jgi:hypothetical protein
MARWLGGSGFGQLAFMLGLRKRPIFQRGRHQHRRACGLSGIAGWENSDHSPTIWISRIPPLNGALKTSAWPRDVRR